MRLVLLAVMLVLAAAASETIWQSRSVSADYYAYWNKTCKSWRAGAATAPEDAVLCMKWFQP